MSEQYTFEQAFQRLESILEQLNTDSVTLDQAVALYEEATALLARCNQQLEKAEAKIEALSTTKQGELVVDAAGEPIVEPWAGSTSP